MLSLEAAAWKLAPGWIDLSRGPEKLDRIENEYCVRVLAMVTVVEKEPEVRELRGGK